MAYIGAQPRLGNFQACDAISTSATDTFNLLVGGVAIFPQTAQHCLVSLNGVLQAPISSYTISSSTIVFASALTSSDSIDFITILGDTLDLGTPSDSTVTTAKLVNSAVDLTSKVTGALPVANGGTALTSGFANGITMADGYRQNADVNHGTGDPVLDSNWEKIDTTSFGFIGTGMSESSGIFTFPATGMYYIAAQCSITDGSATNRVDWRIQTTVDNSSYSDNSIAHMNIPADNTKASGFCSTIFDVQNTSNYKLRFALYDINDVNPATIGSSSNTFTGFMVYRLGNT